MVREHRVRIADKIVATKLTPAEREAILAARKQKPKSAAPASILEALLCLGSDARFEPKPASQPTRARPGSNEKISVLAGRLMAGEGLFHEDDFHCMPDSPPD